MRFNTDVGKRRSVLVKKLNGTFLPRRSSSIHNGGRLSIHATDKSGMDI